MEDRYIRLLEKTKMSEDCVDITITKCNDLLSQMNRHGTIKNAKSEDP